MPNRDCGCRVSAGTGFTADSQRVAGSSLNAAAIVFAGIIIALNIGKLPPALPALREELGLSLVQVSWMVSLFMIAPAFIGLVAGSIIDRFDPGRMMIAGLVIMALAGALGAWAPSTGMLFVSRALESVGYLVAVLPGPSLIARLIEPARLRAWLGIWSAYMPAGMGLALLATPLVLELAGWRGVWTICAALTGIVVVLVAFVHPGVHPDTRQVDPPPIDRSATCDANESAVGRSRRTGADVGRSGEDADNGIITLVHQTLRSPGPWMLSLCFLLYAGQYMGIFSFLPSIYHDAGLSVQWGATLTAIAVIVNMTGNLSAGYLLQHGVSRASLVIFTGLAMAVCEWLAFGSGLAFGWRYAAIVLLSAFGGLIPGTMFATAPFYAPTPAAISTTVGLMQQGSSVGQLIYPLIVATMAQYAGGWDSIWMATGVGALLTVAIGGLIARHDRLRPR